MQRNKGADQLRLQGRKLICAFVFTYSNSRFSHDAAQSIGCDKVMFYVSKSLPFYFIFSYRPIFQQVILKEGEDETAVHGQR